MEKKGKSPKCWELRPQIPELGQTRLPGKIVPPPEFFSEDTLHLDFMTILYHYPLQRSPESVTKCKK